ESGGLIDRASVAADIAALSTAERRALKAFGVRFGAASLFIPAQLAPEPLAFTSAFAAVETPGWTLAGLGLREIAGRRYPALLLERLDERLRADSFVLTDAGLADLDLPRPEAERVLRALGWFTPRKGQDQPWRRRAQKSASPAPANPTSPFAALAAIKA